MNASAPHDYYQPSQDERAIACITHLTIFLSTFGLLVAIGLWIYLRSRHRYAAFQAAQAAIFQFGTMILSFVVIIGALALFFGMFGLGLASGMEPTGTAFGMLVFIVFITFVVLISVFSLLLYVYAIYAAWKCWQGAAFRIPLVSAMAEGLSPMPPIRPEGERP
jgi:uncharacterized Tic20 family protein